MHSPHKATNVGLCRTSKRFGGVVRRSASPLGGREDCRHLVDALFQPSLGQVPGFLTGISVLHYSHRRATSTGL